MGSLEVKGKKRSISGKIDRLAVTPGKVSIVDYKTNRPAPATLAEVPPAYVLQLALYRALLQAATAEGVNLFREGALPGAANWTHEHADAANTRVSKDQLVKAPLGVLWFGGPSQRRHPAAARPRPAAAGHRRPADHRRRRHAAGASTSTPAACCGRRRCPASAPSTTTPPTSPAPTPAAPTSSPRRTASTSCTTAACVRLDPATGKELAASSTSRRGRRAEPPLWGYLNVAGDYLIGGTGPEQRLPDREGPADARRAGRRASRLVVMDRHTGKVLWTATARNGFRHNAICIGGGRLYAIDRLSGPQLSPAQAPRRRAAAPAAAGRLRPDDRQGALEHRGRRLRHLAELLRRSTTCWSRPAASPATRSATSRRACGPTRPATATVAVGQQDATPARP